MILFFVSQESYVYTIGKKLNSFGPIKSEASKATGKNSSGKLFMLTRLEPQYSNAFMHEEGMRITLV
jgi:hypothetical protein